eukprot:TRINITY_DN1852_c0_g1_i1.p1 TRINITY_DN1852_c0_g1~~TRINITY_DN1852_c0_g1_i1.p1  ORF type:complete len:556 (+),score=110.06 TRINITY_DN1852_c0_g1_i1:27-1694(+)
MNHILLLIASSLLVVCCSEGATNSIPPQCFDILQNSVCINITAIGCSTIGMTVYIDDNVYYGPEYIGIHDGLAVLADEDLPCVELDISGFTVSICTELHKLEIESKHVKLCGSAIVLLNGAQMANLTLDCFQVEDCQFLNCDHGCATGQCSIYGTCVCPDDRLGPYCEIATTDFYKNGCLVDPIFLPYSICFNPVVNCEDMKLNVEVTGTPINSNNEYHFSLTHPAHILLDSINVENCNTAVDMQFLITNDDLKGCPTLYVYCDGIEQFHYVGDCNILIQDVCNDDTNDVTTSISIHEDQTETEENDETNIFASQCLYEDICISISHNDCISFTAKLSKGDTILYESDTYTITDNLLDILQDISKDESSYCQSIDISGMNQCQICGEVNNIALDHNNNELHICTSASLKCAGLDISSIDFGCKTISSCDILQCETASCNMHGACSELGLCICSENFYGPFCNIEQSGRCIKSRYLQGDLCINGESNTCDNIDFSVTLKGTEIVSYSQKIDTYNDITLSEDCFDIPIDGCNICFHATIIDDGGIFETKVNYIHISY